MYGKGPSVTHDVSATRLRFFYQPGVFFLMLLVSPLLIIKVIDPVIYNIGCNFQTQDVMQVLLLGL